MNNYKKSRIRESLMHRVELTQENFAFFQIAPNDLLQETILPVYDFHILRPGVVCQECYSFNTYVEAQTTFCESCGGIEDAEETIKRHSEEFLLLFPEVPLTTARIYQWCDGLFSKQRIYRVLRKNYLKVGKTKAVQYQ